MENIALQKLLTQQPALLWRGTQHCPQPNTISTGFSSLDQLLPQQGWPLGIALEIITRQRGAGELRLLMPAIAKLTQQQRYVAWICPPYIPYAHGLRQQNVDLRYFITLNEHINPQDQQWSMEKLLSCEECGMVIMWPQSCSAKNIRRLQIAAEKGNSLGVFYPQVHHTYSPAAMRIALQATGVNQLKIDIVKARGMLKKTSTTLSIPL